MAQNKEKQEEKPVDNYKTFMGARVLWPPECPDDILTASIKKTQEILSQREVSKDGDKIAEELKKYMDATFDPYWHIFFGKNFGCHSIHIKNRFIYFIIDKIAFLMYQTQ